MTVIGVSLSASVAACVLLSHVLHCQVVAQRVADCDRAHSEPIASYRRRNRHVVVQPVYGAAQWRRTDDDQLAALVHCPYLVYRLRNRHLTFTGHIYTHAYE